MKNLYNALQLKQLYQLKALGFRYTNIKPFSFEDITILELPNSLTELKKRVESCHLCPLSKSRDHTVFGEGDSSARIMFIGDYPMDIENNQGRPFLGRAGEMLTLMIEKVLSLSREDVYITNILKCHLPSTQEFHNSYVHSCKSYLFKEIELIKPQIIVTLGEIAYHYLNNEDSRLKDIRGNIIQRDKYKIIPTYHPNFLLKNPSFKKEVFMDLKKVKSLL
ncbi:MAG: uracil-DNA glycosylase [Epsilonproteobacteria bacterium]|nr:uracil-DNA glycosylase [Campylobacterota bacterium]